MSFWLGAMEGLTADRRAEADRNYKETVAGQEKDEAIALTLLESDDPQVQQAGLDILASALEPPKKKKGIRGSLGEYERSQGIRPLLDLANTFSRAMQTPAMPQPGSAALPGASPVEPKAQGPGASQPPMSPLAAAGQAPMEDWSAMLPDLSFGGVPLNAPQQAAADLSITPSGSINMGQVAARVSRDRGVPQPGERQRLFWPTKASIARNVADAHREGDLLAKARVFQQLGATPQQVLSTMMSGEGFSQGAMGLTNSDPMILPGQTAPIETFIRRDPATNQVQVVYIGGPNGELIPVPPGARAVQRAGAAGAGGSLTSYMTGQQMLDAGLITPEDAYDLRQLYKVNQRGDVLTILPYAPPAGPPPQYTGAGVDPATGMPFERDRSGATRPVPGMSAPVLNPKISAARTLLAAIREQERMSGLGTDEATIKQLVEQAVRSGRYPALAGLTYEQVAQLADPKLPTDAPDSMLAPILQAPARITPPPASPMQIPPPPGSAGTPPVAAAPATGGAPPAGWATAIVDEILGNRAKQKPAPGTVQGRPPR